MNLGWLRLCLWLLIYLALALVPMGIALLGEVPASRTWMVEAGSMLGLLGLGVLSAQAVISGRQRWFARGLGPDDLLQFHRQAGLFALLLVFAHPLTMFLADGRYLAFLDPRVNALRAVSLSFVLAGIVLLISSSLWRLTFGLSYERWRLLHGVLALAIVGLGLVHALMVGQYTGPFWKKALLVASVGGALVLMLETRLRRPWRARRRPWRIRAIQPGRGEVWTLQLQPEGHDGLCFRPGQFAWLTLGDTPWQLQQHPFSMASSADDRTVAFTIKDSGDFTGSIGDQRPGGQAWLEGPYGVFTYEPEKCPAGAIFIAGGVGITPFLSMLRTARDRGAREPLWLFYANQHWDEVIFRDELDELTRELSLTLVHILDKPPDAWTGETGYVDDELLDRHLPADVSGMLCYLCGPEAMADSVEPLLIARGVPAKNLYSERFNMV